eukprot:jgi/Tetstr1/454026/TSEL_040945.t1
MTLTATVTGRVAPLPDDMTVSWHAAAPADVRSSFSGAGIPFASQEQAFYAAQTGTVDVGPAGEFELCLEAPNSYHVRSSERPVPPQVILEWTSGGREVSRTITVPLAVQPARSLRAPRAAGGAASAASDVQTQEALLEASRYVAPGGRWRLDPGS